MEKSDWALVGFFGLTIATAIAATAWLFLIKEDYTFTVEAVCDPAAATCYTRDCNELDGCPPNGLETYRVFNIRASDFAVCEDNSCGNECTSGTIRCEEVLCGASEADTCTEHPEQIVQ